MNALSEVRSQAGILGWTRSGDAHTDTFIRGDKMVAVRYGVNGTISSAERYRFFSVKNVHLEERAEGRGKKAYVISWLCEI